MSAAPASSSEPRHAVPVARTEAGHARAHRFDPAHDLVAGHERQHGLRQLAVDEVKINGTDGAGLDPERQLAVAGPWNGKGARLERPTRLLEHHRTHHRAPPSGATS